MTTRPPRVSVVIPAYNAAPFISGAVESVQRQTYRDVEIIVVNDGSPDTQELEVALAPFLSHLVYVRQENGGPGGARNTGVHRARGELVAFLDSDDGWEPEFLSAQVALIDDAAAPLDMVYANANIVGDSPLAGRTFMDTSPSNGPVSFESLLRQECVVLTSTVVARRETLIGAGLFDPEYFHSEDFDLWLRVAHRGGRIGYNRRVLGTHRAHAASLTAEPGSLLRGQIRICDKLTNQLALTDAQRDLLVRHRRWCAAQLALAEGKREFVARRYRAARAHLREAQAELRRPKLAVALAMLSVAPGALHWAYRKRHRDALRAESSVASV
jgi:GT2 family glycosyltransferase